MNFSDWDRGSLLPLPPIWRKGERLGRGGGEERKRGWDGREEMGEEGSCTRPRRMTHDSRALHATPFVEENGGINENGMGRGSGCNDGQRSYPFVFDFSRCIFLHLSLVPQQGDWQIIRFYLFREKKEMEEDEDSGDRREEEAARLE